MREKKSRRENQVTMYRKYRKGDLPDIQIKYSYIIAPLQAVAHVSTPQKRNLSDIQICYSFTTDFESILAVAYRLIYVSGHQSILIKKDSTMLWQCTHIHAVASFLL